MMVFLFFHLKLFCVRSFVIHYYALLVTSSGTATPSLSYGLRHAFFMTCIYKSVESNWMQCILLQCLRMTMRERSGTPLMDLKVTRRGILVDHEELLWIHGETLESADICIVDILFMRYKDESECATGLTAVVIQNDSLSGDSFTTSSLYIICSDQAYDELYIIDSAKSEPRN